MKKRYSIKSPLPEEPNYVKQIKSLDTKGDFITTKEGINVSHSRMSVAK